MSHLPTTKRRSFYSPRRRPGKVVVMFGIALVFLMGVVAVAVDIGFMANGRTELQMAADAGAMAGAGRLPDEAEFVVAEARYFTELNMGELASSPDATVAVEVGQWNRDSRTFVASEEVVNSVRVRVQLTDQPLFFARALGNDTYQLFVEAIASYAPRDMMVVLDFSSSMNDDSEFRQVDTLGEAAIFNGLWDIYQDLGSPTYGNLTWDLVNYSGTTSTSTIRTALGLDGVTYPYPSGNWNAYIDYVKSSFWLNRAGYRHHYGYPTLMNYWLEMQSSSFQSPNLWTTRAQPVTALKNAVTLFVDHVKQGQVTDRLGLVIYSFSDEGALLETGLTYDLELIDNITRQRQAGHYSAITNIGAGLEKAIDELNANARPNAVKRIIMMTDGVANRPGDTVQAKQFARDQAARAAAAGYSVTTISLGASADVELCQEIADTTGGLHFNVPGGRPIAEYEAQLLEVFGKIAAQRPLRLVQ